MVTNRDEIGVQLKLMHKRIYKIKDLRCFVVIYHVQKPMYLSLNLTPIYPVWLYININKNRLSLTLRNLLNRTVSKKEKLTVYNIFERWYI